MGLAERLKVEEGFEAKPYQDFKGVWTFGFGFTSIARDEAELVLDIKIAKIRYRLSSLISDLSVTRQDVIVEMCYMLGSKGLFDFMEMWKAIRNGDFDRAADEILDSKMHRELLEQAGGVLEKTRSYELSEMMRAG